ncbi:MAG: hypothetical protein ABI233_03185 [Chthoniobacterales bacterium]
MKSYSLIILLIISLLLGARADIFTVTNTNATGAGSFNQGIAGVNGHPNPIGVPDRIEFNIPNSDPNRNPATGVFTIVPLIFALRWSRMRS